jgi:hypothetical protein
MMEIGAPTPQNRIEFPEQGGKRSMLVAAGERPDLSDHGGQCLLGWVGVDRFLAATTTLSMAICFSPSAAIFSPQ